MWYIYTPLQWKWTKHNCIHKHRKVTNLHFRKRSHRHNTYYRIPGIYIKDRQCLSMVWVRIWSPLKCFEGSWKGLGGFWIMVTFCGLTWLWLFPYPWYASIKNIKIKYINIKCTLQVSKIISFPYLNVTLEKQMGLHWQLSAMWMAARFLGNVRFNYYKSYFKICWQERNGTVRGLVNRGIYGPAEGMNISR